jgi:hypothetical protein
MAATTHSHTGKGWMTIDLTGTTTHTGGDIANVLNHEGEHLIITRAVLYSTHVSTGAANLNAGIGTTAQHDQTELVNAADIVALTAGTAINGFACGDAADALVIWGEDEYLVVNASADSSGFTGRLHVEYLHV